MVQYIVTEREVNHALQYGIAAREQNEMIYLQDLVPTYEESLRLTAILQENGVAMEHFQDVVEDYLAQ